jgi:GH15 family glucan-1,4-alpha-glucosidase
MAHGVIGDMRTAALIADDGTVDFYCWPKFDSPSVFTSLLDTPAAGDFELAPDLPDARRQQLYIPTTNVLRTRWIDDEAIVELTDFMPIDGEPSRLMRRVEVVSGKARMRLRCRPCHDYARADTQAKMAGSAVHFEADGQPGMMLYASQPLAVEDGAATAEFDVSKGDVFYCQLGGDASRMPASAEFETLLAQTILYWRQWIRHSIYTGRWRDMVERSALALKLLTDRDSGAILAAVTFGLPEHLGGERNWDYRYTWVRDASFTVYAFMRLGLTDEAKHFMRWMGQRLNDKGPSSQSMHLMYSIEGDPNLHEQTLDHLAGHAGSQPVRIGNDAHDQIQLDIYGELLDAVYLSNKYGEAVSHHGWVRVTQIVDEVCEKWDHTDIGIWEMRGEESHYLHSRLMCWVAVDRAIRLAEKRSLPAPFAHWNDTRSAIYMDIYENFWNAERGHFVQRQGSTAVDGAMLLMPLVRFVSATDPQWLATLEEIERRLVRDCMVRRYRTDDSPDGLEGEEGAFVACSFWYVECLARANRVEKAHQVFDKLLRFSNPLGLYSEEFDLQGGHLGNTPQALSHLALISAASFLDRKLSDEQEMWQP